MKLNWNTVQVGEKVILTPYRRKYVQKYHQWMQDAYLQSMTASNPLTIQQEYDMQRSWRDDERKCTFIVLDKAVGEALRYSTAGDVNLFLNDPEDVKVAEIEIMIAEPWCRRRGLGRITQLNIERFYCKISEANGPSLALFKSMGYEQVNYVAAFREIELHFLVGRASNQDDVHRMQSLRSVVGKVEEKPYVEYEVDETGHESNVEGQQERK